MTTIPHSQTYSSGSNCARAAKLKLGAAAQKGRDFDVTKLDMGYVWHELPKEAPPLNTAQEPEPAAEATAEPATEEPAAEATAEEPIPATTVRVRKAKAAKAPKAAKPPKAAKAPKVPKVRPVRLLAEGEKGIGHTPCGQRMLTLIRRKRGVSYDEASETLGMQNHSARGLVSRLRKEFIIVCVKGDDKVMRLTNGAPR